ncbi:MULTISPECIES: hypothetical protein [unclassified Microbacterium]|uniref:hypothetical protein n=1 Tax=unclassified Microbacterium TaxID=2609290 RepID=UPI00386B9D84
MASAVAALDPRTRTVAAPTVADAEPAIAESDRVHVHVTDRLFGSTPEDAASTIERWAAATRLTLTFHDVPQTSDGTMFERRRGAYRRMAVAAEGVVVNSRHEQLLWAEFLAGLPAPHAIALGARTAAPSPSAGDRSPEGARDLRVLIAGFIYPGKGHGPAVRAAADAAALLAARGTPVGRVVVRALGAPSRGHEDDVVELARGAAERGVDVEVTGFLADDDFARELAGEGIPLAAHEHVSASRSMLDWVEAGRRPLVVESRYAAEMDALRPGTLLRYEPGALPARLAEAWADPSLTRLSSGASLAPTLDDVAAAHLAWWAAA